MSTPSDPTGPGAPPPDQRSDYGTTDFGQTHPAEAGDYGAAAVSAPLAGFWIRFAGALIDSILLGIVAAILGALLSGGSMQSSQGISLLLGAIYFTYFHGSTGQSLGQKVVSIKVVDETAGGTVDYVRAFIRWLVSIVSGFALLIGYLWMLWDDKNQTWHDKAARTLVVKV